MAILRNNVSGVLQMGRGLPRYSGSQARSSEPAVAASMTASAASAISGETSECQDDDDGDDDDDDDNDDDDQTGEEPIAN